MTQKERIILFILAGLNFTHNLDFMIMMPLSNYLIPYFKITAFQFSILVASYSVSAFFSGLAVALVIDRFDRKKTLLYAYIGFLIGTIACGFAQSYLLLLAARIIAGTFGGIIGAQVLAIIADLFSYERRGRAVAAVVSAFAVASIVGVPVGLKLTILFHFNWHVPFLIIGGLALLLTPAIIRFIPSLTDHIKPAEHRGGIFEALVNVGKIPPQRKALIFSGLLMIGHFMIIPFISPYVEFNMGFSKRQIPQIFVFGGIASLISALVLGRLSDKVGKLPVFNWAVFLSLFMLILITRMPDVHFVFVITFFSVWFILATARALMAQAMITEVVEAEQRGSFMSVNGSVQQLGSGIAALMAGAIVHTTKTGVILNYNWVGYLSIAVLIGTMYMGRRVFAHMDRGRTKLQAAPAETENG